MGAKRRPEKIISTKVKRRNVYKKTYYTFKKISLKKSTIHYCKFHILQNYPNIKQEQ